MLKEKINIKLMLFVLISVGWLILFNTKNVQAAEERSIQITREITLKDVEDIEELEMVIINIPDVIVLRNNGGSDYVQYSLLIPRERFDENLNKIIEFGTVTEDTRYQSDITSEVTRLEKSIISNEKHKEVIMEMLEKSKTMEAILEFEQYLMNVEIEQTTNQNQLYGLNDLSNYTTLNLWVEETPEITPLLDDSFGSRLSIAFKYSFTDTVSLFENIIVGLSYIILPLIFGFIITAIVIKVGKRGKANEEK